MEKTKYENKAQEELKKFEIELGNGYVDPSSFMHLFGELYFRIEELEQKVKWLREDMYL